MAKVKRLTNVFISYARADAHRIDGIVQSLVARGLLKEGDRILREEDLPVKHGALRDQVRKRIQSASKLIVIWGTASANSQWVNYEIGLADALGKPIMVVIPSKSDLVALPANLQNVQVINL
jgi:TIR domain